ncbi:hypothetical protein BH11CYA1_BH11CYA1_36130 [soil metagenome]
MFHSSYQNLSFRQQIIAANQSYPCPRCSSGMIEPFGITETLKCTSCERSFVALRGGRMLYPANSMGLKIALTFWWDGLRWHCAGTTASSRHMVMPALFLASPVALLLLSLNLLVSKPEWASPPLAAAAGMLVGLLLIYSYCGDFDVVAKRKERTSKSPQPDRPTSGS